ANVRLQDVDAAVLQVGNDLPDGAVPLAGCDWNADLLLEPLEHLDVARHGGFFEKKDVVRSNGAGELDQHGWRNGAMRVEHDGVVGALALACVLDHLRQPEDVLRIARERVWAAGAELVRLRTGVHADLVAARPPEQTIDRHAPRLASDVPQG